MGKLGWFITKTKTATGRSSEGEPHHGDTWVPPNPSLKVEREKKKKERKKSAYVECLHFVVHSALFINKRIFEIKLRWQEKATRSVVSTSELSTVQMSMPSNVRFHSWLFGLIFFSFLSSRLNSFPAVLFQTSWDARGGTLLACRGVIVVFSTRSVASRNVIES